ncbi:MAG: glycosyltransferase family 2 protein [Pirellulaceae bacterium]
MAYQDPVDFTTSPPSPCSPPPGDRANDTWAQLAQRLAQASGHVTWAERVEWLHALLGDDLCRHMGVYRLPAGFLLSVVIPVYNEAQTIEQVVARVRGTQLPLEMILVDDGSTDGTRDVLQRLAHDADCRIILHEHNQGKGAALKSGMAAARGDVVVIQDADMEYDPRDFRLLLQPIIENEADVVFGSRFIHNDRPVSPLWHQGANQLITLCAVLASGYRFTDVETCYKMFRRELLQDVVPTLREKRFGIEIELTFKLVKQRGVRFYERPIRYARRSYAEGKKIGWRDGLAALWCILRYAFVG